MVSHWLQVYFVAKANRTCWRGYEREELTLTSGMWAEMEVVRGSQVGGLQCQVLTLARSVWGVTQ